MIFQLDCGATVNILPVEIYQQIFNDPQMRGVQSKQTTLVVFNESELESLGCVRAGKLNLKNEECFVTENTLSQKAIKHF